jgi:hypothetical protein
MQFPAQCRAGDLKNLPAPALMGGRAGLRLRRGLVLARPAGSYEGPFRLALRTQCGLLSPPLLPALPPAHGLSTIGGARHDGDAQTSGHANAENRKALSMLVHCQYTQRLGCSRG